jgi:hypothetical protein
VKKENTEVGFVINGIKTEQFAIFEENFTSKKEACLETELQFKLDQSNKQMAVFLEFEFIQGKKVFLKVQVSCHFKIDEGYWNLFIQENKLIVSKDFLAHLVMISIGTSRGVLFAKTEATQFSKYIIPSINVAEMIKEDASFDMVVE